MVAHNRRNWAITIMTPAAISCSGLIITLINARAAAVKNEPTATAVCALWFGRIKPFSFPLLITSQTERVAGTPTTLKSNTLI